METKPERINWHARPVTELVAALETNFESGLTHTESERRLETFGRNELSETGHETVLDLIWKQVKSPLVLVLIVAGFASLLLGEIASAIVVAITVAINVTIGVVQEGRASKAFLELQKSQTKYATVIRGAIKRVVPAGELVPGDLVEIESGNVVPADLRLVHVSNLMVNESALTGEWKSEDKTLGELSESTAMADRKNLAYKGTMVVFGEARGVVTATAANTEIGKIAGSLGRDDDTTPLQKAIKRLAKLIIVAVAIVLLLVLVLGLIRGESFGSMLLTSIALAVSAIPEGLPVAVTVILVVGMKRILSKGGFVRSMLAAETLGSTTVILTDKTGTLTKGEMLVKELITASGSKKERDQALRTAVLASDGFVGSDGKVHGRPVEQALVKAGLEHNLEQPMLFKAQERIDFLKFASSRRFAASLNTCKAPEGSKLDKNFYITGAPETLLSASTHIYDDGEEVELNDKKRSELMQQYSNAASEGMRLIAVAYKRTADNNFEKSEGKIRTQVLDKAVFVAFVALSDKVRDDVAESIATAKGAGAEVIMMTGDHLSTALSIAREVGIASPGDTGLTGSDVENMSDKELLLKLRDTEVFARMLPETKLRVAKLLKEAGHVVAMTGDGVNDAPALRNADIGVALGSGTEVAKEASDLVLTNNNFSIIVDAIKEGRRLLDNIKKSVAFLLSTSFSTVVLIAGSLFVGLPLPLLPKQILWENVVEGGLLNIIFAFEPGEKDIMARKPASLGARNITSGKIRGMISLTSLITGLSTLFLFYYLHNTGVNIDVARTVVFLMVSINIVFVVFSYKNLNKPLFKTNIFTNKMIFAALLVALVGVLVAFYVPFFSNLLSLVDINSTHVLIVSVIGIFNILLVELAKFAIFRPT